ncbi:putative doxorubicin resistance ABC transporter permease protein DrrC [Anaerolineae bacterium]|nr:putative doxorubicin resistance ABC transporter permease protein DrrC [Anaerolineae bacterium]
MTVITTTSTMTRMRSQGEMPLWKQITMLTWRNLVVTFRTLAEIIPSFIISAFFLFVYNASLGDAARFLPGLSGNSYLGFILPVSVVSAALSGAGIAGFAIVRDIESGYFDKLMLTPVRRVALLMGAILNSAIILVMQTGLVVVIGLLMGLQPATGLLGTLAALSIALLIGVAFAGFTVGVALRTGSAGATQGATFMFFPLTFLTATFVPVTLLSGWIKTAAQLNPITYILEAMRALLNEGWQGSVLLNGVLACVVLGVVTFSFAMSSLRARTRQR